MAAYGYSGKILRVDLSSGNVSSISTLDYADRFLGGRGIAAKIYWDEVSPAVGALDAMKDEYYKLRGWDVATGLQTKAQLESIGLGDIAGEMEERGLVA